MTTRLTPRNMRHILIFIYAVSVVWWITIFARGIKETTENYFFNIPMAAIPMIAGAYGLTQFFRNKKTNRTGGRDHHFALITGSIALLAWGAGNLVYLYYNLVQEIASPHHSLANVLYNSALLFWILTFVFLFGMIGKKKIVLGGLKRLCVVVIITVLALAMMHVVLVNQFTPPHLPQFLLLNIATLIPEVFIFFEIGMLAYIVIMHSERRILNVLFFAIIGFSLHYLADLNYTRYAEQYIVGGWIDCIFLTAILFESLCIIALTQIQIPDKKKL